MIGDYGFRVQEVLGCCCEKSGQGLKHKKVETAFITGRKNCGSQEGSLFVCRLHIDRRCALKKSYETLVHTMVIIYFCCVL